MKMKPKVILTAALLRTELASILSVIALAGWFPTVGAAEPVLTAILDDYQKFVAPLFAKSCVDCHGPKKSEAGLRVDELDPNLFTGGSVDRWVEIYDVLSQSEMPPVDKPGQPATRTVGVGSRGRDCFALVSSVN